MLSNQSLLPNYAHNLNIFVTRNLIKTNLFLNRNIINQVEKDIFYIISFYCGKRTNRNKRKKILASLSTNLSIIFENFNILHPQLKEDLKIQNENFLKVKEDFNK